MLVIAITTGIVLFFIILLLFTQVIIPLVKNRKMFPLFTKRGKMEREIAALLEKYDHQTLSKEIDRLTKRVNKGEAK